MTVREANRRIAELLGETRTLGMEDGEQYWQARYCEERRKADAAQKRIAELEKPCLCCSQAQPCGDGCRCKTDQHGSLDMEDGERKADAAQKRIAELEARPYPSGSGSSAFRNSAIKPSSFAGVSLTTFQIGG